MIRSKNADIDARYITHLGDLLRDPEMDYHEWVYHEMNWRCMFCYKTTLVQGMLPMEYHAAEKHQLAIRDSMKAALTDFGAIGNDNDECVMTVIHFVPLKKRQKLVLIENQCRVCLQRFSCECLLQKHFQEKHKTKYYCPRQDILCPHCLIRAENKCDVLMHIYMEHPHKKNVALEALLERRHVEVKYEFEKDILHCDKCCGFRFKF